MKIILTGATGFVGSEVLGQLVEAPEVTTVSCLTRRPVEICSDKVESIVVDDFADYDAGLLARLSDHAGCVWTLGGKASDADDPALYHRITHDFTLALASGLAARTEVFTFCYLSGAGADPEQSSVIPWERITRYAKGHAEKDLAALQQHSPGFEVHSFRPAGVLERDANPVVRTLCAPISIRVDELAAGLIASVTGECAVVPAVVSNSNIKRIARGKEPMYRQPRSAVHLRRV